MGAVQSNVMGCRQHPVSEVVHSLVLGTTCIALMMLCLITAPAGGEALQADGEALFNHNCVGCHINGGNIIRRGRTLKRAALERNGLDSVDAIARVAREGIGQMSGYGDALGPNGDQIVAAWIWEQAQNAWTHG